MGDNSEKTSMPVLPTKEECDAEYSRARTSLDGRASPFVPGVGLRLSQEFKPIDLNDAPPLEESEQEVARRGMFVTRSHRSVTSLTSGLNGSESPPADGKKAEVTVEVTRRGKFVTRTHHSVSPLTTEPETPPPPERERSQVDTPGMDTTSPSPETPVVDTPGMDTVSPPPHIRDMDTLSPSPPPQTRNVKKLPPAETPGMKTASPPPETRDVDTLSPPAKYHDLDAASPPPTESRDLDALSPPAEARGTDAVSPPAETTGMDTASPPSLPPRSEEDSSCDCATTDPVTKESAWEQTSSSRVSGVDSIDGGSINTTSIRISPAKTLDLRIFCGTWNVAARKIDDVEDMGLWLDVDKLDNEGEASDPPDLFVVGFQEVVELSAQNVVMDSFLDTQSKANSLQWFALVYAYLARYGQRHGRKYVMVSEQRLLGTYILVMATESVCTKIANVQSAIVPTGLGGYLGNKGAVSVRMEVGGTSSLCFVCVHMAAHRENVLARNAEYKAISSKPVFADTNGRLPVDEAEDTAGKDKDKRQGSTWGSLFGGVGQGVRSGGMSPTRNSEVKKAIRAAMAFGLPKGGGKEAGLAAGDSPGKDGGVDTEDNRNEDEKGTSTVEEEGMDDFAWVPSVQNSGAGLPKTKTVLQADIVFWLGDLNYRISEEVPDEQVFEMLKNNDLDTLRGLDQLNLARASGAAFEEFQEGPLCFPPSYKYIPGTKEFDNRPEKKVRCPSWCDRVLYSMGMQGDSVKRLGLDRYWSSGPLVSDHMPVSALFRTSLACVAEKTVVESEMDVEPLSPKKAAAKTAFESVPFAKVVLDPPALVLELDQTPVLSAVTAISNVGGVRGVYHVCKDSLPGWISLDGNERGSLEPGEKVEIGIVIDAVQAQADLAKEPDGAPRQACAVLPVEVDGGGSGTLLSIVCNGDK